MLIYVTLSLITFFLLNCTGWELRDCEGVDIAGYGFKPVSKNACAKQSDEMTECTFAVYGGPGGKTGSSSDWWAERCIPRKKFSGICKNENWMWTYVKQNSGSDKVITWQ